MKPVLLHVATVSMSTVFLRGQAAYMKERGFEVHVVTSPGAELEAFGRDEGAEVHAVPMPRRMSPGRDLRALARLHRLMGRVRPRIVHAHTPKGGLLGMLAAAARGVPVRVYQMRGLPFVTEAGARRALLRGTERIACRLAHRVLTNSRSLREVAVENRLCPPGKIDVLCGGSGNGVDAMLRFDPDRLDVSERLGTRARFGIPADARVVGFVGRIGRDKGVVELGEAWRTLTQTRPDLHLLMVGPFEPRDPVPPETAHLLREDPRVHLAGMDWNTPPLYAAMDLVVLPSHREGFPNVPLEAAAMRLPVVATRVPGCVDAVVDGETGLLVPPRDAEALSRAIATHLDDSALRQRHGEAGRERALRDFRPEQIWEALYSEYVALLRSAGLPRRVEDAGGSGSRVRWAPTQR